MLAALCLRSFAGRYLKDGNQFLNALYFLRYCLPAIIECNDCEIQNKIIMIIKPSILLAT